MIATLGLALLLQQGAFLGSTTPPAGDTTGYWQQRVRYTIVGTLDEERETLAARGELVYHNRSPDTLQAIYVHQYLNAFRPGSRWSAEDAREGRVRFQNLAEPHYGYERFTVPPRAHGRPLRVLYPGAPDSTIAMIELPRALPPGDSIHIELAWEARPSTVFRRQGRRGRTYDFAQWYPKVAVYDRGGWQINPLIPAGEFYGEFGDYDVTLVVRDDQVLGATGVPVSGDPGWARVSRTGVPPRLASRAYSNLPPAPAVDVPGGSRAVRFFARDVHHFAWSASTEYRYEGTVYMRESPVSRRFPTWDTVSIHILFKPGDDSTWGNGLALRRTSEALRWLEDMYGPYAYPQVTNLHRLDGGGTEFPMLIMDGSASYGLILHEVGHIFSYGILANNEWRSGWLDEGIADYHTYWAQNLTPQERIATRGARPPPLLVAGYRGAGITIPPEVANEALATLTQTQLELLGRAQPIGTNSADFSEFGVYNQMVYGRALAMFAHLRDVLGDSTYRRFLRTYYDRWALKHVDERAVRAVASEVYGANLDWFFDQWIHRTGLLDYGINSVSSRQDSTGRWVTLVDLGRHGSYVHPIPVGIYTGRGWSIARANAGLPRQILQIVTSEQPDSVVIDPFHVTSDWDWRNNVAPVWPLPGPRRLRAGVDWPFLNQADRAHTLALFWPAVWVSGPQGTTIGVRVRTSYLGMVDRYDKGIGFTERNPLPVPGGTIGKIHRVPLWWRVADPHFGFLDRPLMGFSAGFASLDGIAKVDAAKEWDLSPFIIAAGPRITARLGVDGAFPTQSPLLPEQWTNTRVAEASAGLSVRGAPRADGVIVSGQVDIGGGYAAPRHAPGERAYGRLLASLTTTAPVAGARRTLSVRAVAGWAPRAPLQRSLFASSADPFETFSNHYFRPRRALLKQTNVNFRAAGGAWLRGYSPLLALDQVVGANVDLTQRLHEWTRGEARFALHAGAFADGAAVRIAPESPLGSRERHLADGGVGLLARGRLYDRDITLRFDLPLALSHPALGHGHASGNGAVAIRWAFSVGEIR